MTKAQKRRFVSQNEPVRLRVSVDHCQAGEVVKLKFPKGLLKRGEKVCINKLVVGARCKAGKQLLIVADDIE